ncbi:hypothetical protein LEM8419_00626 [Neolewinella maritima]|uniref:Endonuclease/exonuclease/phosphatase domain-containing protein n=1 Tax=Neolewinella maritima TaxID=1383882 RepID=A0ABM9AYE9_9BACT|nr:ExeM/NucH family extracellular endonuclease [Neolewinella maritima]CAH0999328.1 hypothetical protein LEM8419_00626 [Neolewinella maritima]
MKPVLLYLSLLCSLFITAQDRVLITGLLDGTAPGATPRAVELYVKGTVDLSAYTVQRYANTNTEGTPITLSGTYTDAFVYVVNGTDAFAEAFGTAGDFANVIASGTVSGNGNDAFTLELDGSIVDQVGGPIGDDTSIYTDSYLYRTNGTGPDGTWVADNWITPGNNLLDGLTLVEIGAIVPFGTYQGGGGSDGPTLSITATTDLAEPGTDGGFTVSLSTAADSDLTLSYALSGTATPGTDYLTTGDQQATIPSGELSVSVILTVVEDEQIEGSETIVVTLGAISDTSYTSGAPAELLLLDDDLGTDPIAIHIVQGRGETSPLAGNTVTVEAIVTGDFVDGLDGFYVQEEDADADQDSLTSEGVFVFAPNASVTMGELVTVTGVVEERFGQTQIRGGGDAGAAITRKSAGADLPTAVILTLPRADSLLEALEGMRVTPRDLVITDVSSLARFGEVEVTSDERIIQFTECNRPDAAALAAYRDSISADLLLIDDGRGGSNNLPILFAGTDTLEASDQIRAGQTISGLTGVLGYGFRRYRIQPTQTENLRLSGNDRPTSAPEVGGELRVVSANVLNYFTTLNSRGADTEAELIRQEDKIVAALCELNADIIGLIEIENNDNIALARLVDALSTRCGVPYAFVVSPNTGDDQIMVALVYRTDRIEESGTAAALASPDSLFVGRSTNRVPLAQTFRVIDAGSSNLGEELTVCVNHFKSKGGGCGPGNDDDGGAGNCNGTRAKGARALAAWLATDPTGVDDPDVLVIGDLNAYRMEEPIRVLEDAGYVNTKRLLGNDRFPCAGGPPSYVFGGAWGSLDYALASDSLAPFITGATAWTVNAPEPAILDYNTEGASDSLYAPDFYRFSDHDPIVVGIDLSQLVNSVPNSVPNGSGAELMRTGSHTYTFAGLQRAGSYLLTNSAGQVLGSGTARILGTQLSVAGLPAGVYFVVLREPGAGQATFKLAVL